MKLQTSIILMKVQHVFVAQIIQRNIIINYERIYFIYLILNIIILCIVILIFEYFEFGQLKYIACS